jgi:hypothetical protein
LTKAAEVTLTIEPKADHSVSPASHLNTIELAVSGSSEWLELEVTRDRSDLSLSEHFQLSIYARPSRPVSCAAVLRFPHKAGPPVDIGLANFELHDDERNVIASGDLATPTLYSWTRPRSPP